MAIRPAIARLAPLVIFGAAALAVVRGSAAQDDNATIARTIKTDVGQFIAGINAHDVGRATAFDATDIVSMECGRPSSTTLAAEQTGLRDAFAHNPDWHVRLIDETVDVAKAGDMAVYRSTYYQDSSRSGQPTTQTVSFVAGFKRVVDGSWKVAWSIVAPTEAMHTK
jgi:ketosteroid isomerase-like protein